VMLKSNGYGVMLQWVALATELATYGVTVVLQWCHRVLTVL
jgi:hypothetical protein